MGNEMDIIDFVDYLKEKEGNRFRTDSDVASYLNITRTQLSQWRKTGRNLTNLQIDRLFEKSRKAAAIKIRRSAIKPIVEFFPIDYTESRQGKNWELFSTDDSASQHVRGLRQKLSTSKGVYLFYDTRGHALYAGRTTNQNLWAEMNNALNRPRETQKIKLVQHPTRSQKFVSASDQPRSIKNTPVLLADMAGFFSAYEVELGMVAAVEALLIRAFANDLLNARMESF